MHSSLIIGVAILYLVACVVTLSSIYHAPEGQETEEGFIPAPAESENAAMISGFRAVSMREG